MPSTFRFFLDKKDTGLRSSASNDPDDDKHDTGYTEMNCREMCPRGANIWTVMTKAKKMAFQIYFWPHSKTAELRMPKKKIMPLKVHKAECVIDREEGTITSEEYVFKTESSLSYFKFTSS